MTDITWQSGGMKPAVDFGGPITGIAPDVFVSGRRGELSMHSKDLSLWMGVPNKLISFDLINLLLIRPESWAVGNCWNRTVTMRHDHSDLTSVEECSYWISQSVAADLCRQYRRDLLPEVASIFRAARERDLRRWEVAA